MPRRLIIPRHQTHAHPQRRQPLQQPPPLHRIRLQEDLAHQRRGRRPRMLHRRPVHLRQVEARAVQLEDDGDGLGALGTRGPRQAVEVVVVGAAVQGGLGACAVLDVGTVEEDEGGAVL